MAYFYSKEREVERDGKRNGKKVKREIREVKVEEAICPTQKFWSGTFYGCGHAWLGEQMVGIWERSSAVGSRGNWSIYFISFEIKVLYCKNYLKFWHKAQSLNCRKIHWLKIIRLVWTVGSSKSGMAKAISGYSMPKSAMAMAIVAMAPPLTVTIYHYMMIFATIYA